MDQGPGPARDPYPTIHTPIIRDFPWFITMLLLWDPVPVPLLDGVAVDNQTFWQSGKVMLFVSYPVPYPMHTRSIPQTCVCHHQPMFDIKQWWSHLVARSSRAVRCVCVWEALEQRVIVQPAGGGSYLDCLTCSSGSPTKRLLQVTDMDSGRKIHVPAFHINSEVSCKGKRLSLEPPRRACWALVNSIHVDIVISQPWFTWCITWYHLISCHVLSLRGVSKCVFVRVCLFLDL